MKVTQLGANTIQLTRWPLLFPVNVYLVREDDGFTLIDAAVGGSAPKILSITKHLGAPVVRVALTHAHGDHVGSLDALHESLPETEILMTVQSARFLSGDLNLEPTGDQEKIPGQFKTMATKPTETLAPGDRVGSLEVVASPGHSPDHISFFDTRDRTLIAGDAFQTRGGTAVSGTLKPLFPFPAMATWDKEAALRSARELRSLNPDWLAVGHGNSIEEPGPAMDRAIQQAERKLGSIARHAS